MSKRHDYQLITRFHDLQDLPEFKVRIIRQNPFIRR
jgi:hypothetical protein